MVSTTKAAGSTDTDMDKGNSNKQQEWFTMVIGFMAKNKDLEK